MTYQSYSSEDINVKPSDIKPELMLTGKYDLKTLASKTKPGDYISLVNENNLSEVIIYKRNAFYGEDPRIMRWDGKTVDCSWFSDDKKIYLISNAEQLAGLQKLVSLGCTFEGRTIRLISNINLDHKEWAPIGEPYEEERIYNSQDTFYKIHMDEEHSFKGTFDGNGYIIYGLKMSIIESGCRFVGFFRTLKHAVVKNVIFEDVKIGSYLDHSSFATVFGYAESSCFMNIIVSGEICGQRCSGIGAIAVDSSFYDCINRANLTCWSKYANSRIVIGGMVQQIGLSDEMVLKIHEKEPSVFVNCMQAGNIKANTENAAVFSAGQLYGYLSHEIDGESYGMLIDRCRISSGNSISVTNFDLNQTRASFFGKRDDGSEPVNHVSGTNDKVDLMNGLIGKTSNAIKVTVIKVTNSVTVDSMVIPGSVNVLTSKPYTNSFVTMDTNPIGTYDGIENLEPYFSFIKTAKS